jgi:hypothetical protein
VLTVCGDNAFPGRSIKHIGFKKKLLHLELGTVVNRSSYTTWYWGEIDPVLMLRIWPIVDEWSGEAPTNIPR